MPSCPTVSLFPFVDDPSQSPIPLPGPNGVLPVFNNGAPTGAIVVRSDRLDNNRLKNTRVTYRRAVEFDLLPQSLLCASVETGYRSGGFDPATGFETYQPEYITAYTAGLKIASSPTRCSSTWKRSGGTIATSRCPPFATTWTVAPPI